MKLTKQAFTALLAASAPSIAAAFSSAFFQPPHSSISHHRFQNDVTPNRSGSLIQPTAFSRTKNSHSKSYVVLHAVNDDDEEEEKVENPYADPNYPDVS